MSKSISEYKPAPEDDDLKAKVKVADPMIKALLSELEKEIERLQKKIVKQEVAHKSERTYLREKIKELESDPVRVVIERVDSKDM